MALFDFLRKKQPQNEEIADFVIYGNETLVKIIEGKSGKKVWAKWHDSEPIKVTLSERITGMLWTIRESY